MTFQYSDINPSMPVAYSSHEAMHTRMEMVLAGITGKDKVQAIVQSVWDSIDKDDSLLNRFLMESELYKVNMTAFENDVHLSEELFMILRMCQVFQKETDGYFDITANMASRGSQGDTGYILDDSRHTIRFLKQETKLDLGGFAKGYTLEKAGKQLRNAGVGYGIVNLGDSSSLAIGTHPFGQWWPIGMEHPYFKGRVLHEFHLKDSALSISGRNRNGQAHIIDPMTGNLVDSESIIAVTGPSPLVTEVLSTAIYTAPEGKREEIMVRFPEYIAYKIVPLCNGDGNILKI